MRLFYCLHTEKLREFHIQFEQMLDFYIYQFDRNVQKFD
jgi:hypothetical protein